MTLAPQTLKDAQLMMAAMRIISDNTNAPDDSPEYEKQLHARMDKFMDEFRELCIKYDLGGVAMAKDLNRKKSVGTVAGTMANISVTSLSAMLLEVFFGGQDNVQKSRDNDDTFKAGQLCDKMREIFRSKAEWDKTGIVSLTPGKEATS